MINTYLQLIQRRSSNSSTLPRSYCFNTFLYDKESTVGHSAVKRWTRKVNIFDYDLVFFPIHLGNHWTLDYADIRKKTLRYCDSMGGNNPKCLAALFDYLKVKFFRPYVSKSKLRSRAWKKLNDRLKTTGRPNPFRERSHNSRTPMVGL